MFKRPEDAMVRRCGQGYRAAGHAASTRVELFEMRRLPKACALDNFMDSGSIPAKAMELR